MPADLLTPFLPAISNVPPVNDGDIVRHAVMDLVMGVVKSQARPRLRVSDGVTRQSSSTKGRMMFQRRPVTAPLYVWSWMALRQFPSAGQPRIAGAEPKPVKFPMVPVSQKPDPKAAVPDVHLIGAEIDAGVNFMLAANQVEDRL